MRMADSNRRQWALKEITYFDHATHRFVAGDLEIDGERIRAIAPPGESKVERAVQAREWIATPGLVQARSDTPTTAAQFDRLLRAGTTTVGTRCATGGECIVAINRTRLRLVARLLLNPFAQARSGQRRPDSQARAPELRAFECIEALVRRQGGRLSLAVHCPSIASAYELVYARNAAAALRLDLGFELSEDERAARAFRERFYCSEVYLLDYLQLLQPGTTVWGPAQLTRGDIDILARSGAAVPGLEAISNPKRRAHGRSQTSDETDATASAFGARIGVAGAEAEAEADRCVDAVTVSAAAALGERTCGSIARGMRADLCLFAPSLRPALGGGSEAFVRLFESRRPDAVIVGGAIAHSESNTPIPWISGSSAAPSHRNVRPVPLTLST